MLGALGASAGPLDPGTIAYGAFVLDLVGVAFLGLLYAGLARRATGRSRRFRKAIEGLFFAWVGMTLVWRFVLPAAVGTDLVSLFLAIQSIFEEVPPEVARVAGVAYGVLGLWTAAGAVFLAAHAAIILDRRACGEDDWVRDLPAWPWLVAAALSFSGTALLAASMASQLAGGPIGNVAAGALLKLFIAPNLFASAYGASLRLALAVRREESGPTGGAEPARPAP